MERGGEMNKNTIKIDWTDKVIELTKQMYRELCQKSESHLRDELIKMGWIPPNLTQTAGESKTSTKCGRCGTILRGGTKQTSGRVYCLHCRLEGKHGV